MGYLTKNFHTLLFAFQVNFTQPSFELFCTLITGWVLSTRHRYITELIYAGDQVGKGHWSRFHRFFSRNSWSLDNVCLTLTSRLIDVFAPAGEVIIALDDTLCRKRGLHLYGAGMHYDPLISSKAVKLVSWGHDWVVLTLVVRWPSWASTKVFSLPIAFRLYRNRQGNNKGKKNKQNEDTRSRLSKSKGRKTSKTKKSQTVPAAKAPAEPQRTRPELGLELICLIANAFAHRTFVVVVDSLYGGQSILSHLPANVHLISRVHPKGAMYAPAPTQTVKGKRGAKRRKGERLSSMEDWANDSTSWTNYKFAQYGLHAKLSTKTRQGLYYKAGKDRLLTFVLTRDNSGKRPLGIFYSTLLDWKTRDILAAYACRWSIEVSFENGKQMLGFEDPANRLPKAVHRTAPMAMILVSLITLWFHQDGYRHVKFPFRPWYRRKKEPSFADMLGTLRRLSWTELWRRAGSSHRQRNKLFSHITEFVSRAG
jgi:hypothetical protein